MDAGKESHGGSECVGSVRYFCISKVSLFL